MEILGIDPGNRQSAYALIRMPTFELVDFGKLENVQLLEKLSGISADEVAIEMIESYGMPVGKDVFETCVWIGRFIQAMYWRDVSCVYRRHEKQYICGSPCAGDGNIRRALIDRYADFDFKTGKGTKKRPDVFHGVSRDVWQAIAVGVTYWEMRK